MTPAERAEVVAALFAAPGLLRLLAAAWAS